MFFYIQNASSIGECSSENFKSNLRQEYGGTIFGFKKRLCNLFCQIVGTMLSIIIFLTSVWHTVFTIVLSYVPPSKYVHKHDYLNSFLWRIYESAWPLFYQCKWRPNPTNNAMEEQLFLLILSKFTEKVFILNDSKDKVRNRRPVTKPPKFV